MLDLASSSGASSSGSSSSSSEKMHDLSAQEGDGVVDGENSAPTVPGTPPLTPSRCRKPSSGKEEDAMWSLMKLATPVKSPGLRAACGDTSAGGAGAGAAAVCTGGAEMTPVSLFNKSRQPGEIGGHLQSPFQSPFKNFQFSPSCLFSPPGAGTLDFPLAGGDTPGPPSSNRSELWQQTTPDRRAGQRAGGGEGKAGRGGAVGVGSGRDAADGGDGGDDVDGGVGGGGVGGTTPGSCGKRKGKALFTDKRGPQDHHSNGLGGGGQGWCLGTPMRSAREGGVVHHHLGVTDIPATPDRTAGADGSHVLPPTPQLLPPTTPSRATREVAQSAAGGDDAAGILMGLRSPESLSAYNGGAGGKIDDALFSGLDGAGGGGESGGGRGGGHQGVADRGWSDDWDSGRGAGAGVFVRSAPHTAPVKRYKGSFAVSLRNAHCKGSFTIERGTLIRSASSCSSSVGTGGGSNSSKGRTGSTGSSSSSNSSSRNSNNSTSTSKNSNTISRKKSRDTAAGDGASRAAACQVRSRGQSIEEEPLSPVKPVLSPGPDALAMSRCSVSLSPARPPASRRAVCVGADGTPSTAPRPSARGARGDRSKRGAAAAAATVVTSSNGTASSVITPSPAVPGSRSGRNSARKPPSSSRAGSALKVKGTPPPRSSRACKAELESSSFNSPEPTTSSAPSASMRRRRGGGSSSSAHKAKQEKQGARAPPTPSPPTPTQLPSTASAATASVSSGGSDSADTAVSAPGGGCAGGAGGGGDPLAVTCNCKKSKCLKLYCECFQRLQYCSGCNCVECLNTERTEALRQVAIQGTIERNPQAFVSKFEKRAGKRSHNAGCNCKKSACLKKYCECFQAGVACGTNCKCVNCQNYEGAAGGRKRRAVEAPVSSTPRTPPRVSPRARATAVVAPLTKEEEGEEEEEDGATNGGGDGSASAAPAPSPDHHVQVGGDDDEEEGGAPPLAEALRGGGPLFSSALATGGRSGIVSDTPPADAVAAAAAAFAAQNNSRAALGNAASSASSPAASAVADCAVARSLLDMGGTPLQVQDEEGAESKFELSVAAGSPGGIHGLSARLLQEQQHGSSSGGGDSKSADRDGVGGGKGDKSGGGGGGGGGGGNGDGVDDAIGMDALLMRFRKESSKQAAHAAAAAAATAAGSPGVLGRAGGAGGSENTSASASAVVAI